MDGATEKHILGRGQRPLECAICFHLAKLVVHALFFEVLVAREEAKYIVVLQVHRACTHARPLIGSKIGTSVRMRMDCCWCLAADVFFLVCERSCIHDRSRSSTESQ